MSGGADAVLSRRSVSAKCTTVFVGEKREMLPKGREEGSRVKNTFFQNVVDDSFDHLERFAEKGRERAAKKKEEKFEREIRHQSFRFSPDSSFPAFPPFLLRLSLTIYYSSFSSFFPDSSCLTQRVREEKKEEFHHHAHTSALLLLVSSFVH